jgi:C4-dicarboxylate-specific signal transduction histidine kinase/ABC-type uncharacterized transport system substrate-binding protein
MSMDAPEFYPVVAVARVLGICGLSPALIAAFICIASPLSAQDRSQRVVMLHSYSYANPGTTISSDAARKRLLERSRDNIKIDADFLDLVRVSDPEHELRMATFLRDKYAQTPPDVILSLGAAAFPFIVKYRDLIAPKAPVVFAGVSHANYASLQPPPDVTGIIIDLDLDKTLSLAERLQPNAQRLYVIAGSARVDRLWQATARKIVESRARKFETTYLFELSLDALVTEVSKVPPDAIVVVLTVFIDGDGQTRQPAEVTTAVTAVSRAPVYSPYHLMLGMGVVGGFSETFESIGIAVADLAMEILAGKDPATIPPRSNPEQAYRVDFKAMQRWNLREADLPGGTIVMFKDPGIWETHRNFVLAVIAAFALQSAVVAFLLFQMRKRKQAEISLKESEDRLAFAAAATNIGIWRLEVASNSFWSTEHCRSMFRLEPQVPLALDTLLDAVHPEDRHSLAATLASAVDSGSPVDCEFRVALPGQEPRWLSARGHSLFDDSGKPLRISGIFADVTARKVAEAEADLQRKEVSHLMRVSVLGELSGAIAHELNQPLTAILAYAQAARKIIARKNPELGRISEVLDDIVQEDNRASEVIRRLHRLLRKGESKAESISLNELVDSTLRLLRSELVGRRIKVDVALEHDLPRASGDPVQLQQVLLNLLMNAMDAMNTTPSVQRMISVGTRSSGKEAIEAFISDRGRGIAAEEHALIFQPFFTTKHHGLGLGLAICSTIVKAHGGKLGIDNNADGGATASFTLPAVVELVPV